MKPTLFKTKNGNTYLYSPVKKRILPIPEHLSDLNLNSYVEDRFGRYLFDNNYLDEYNETYEVRIDKTDINSALANVPQIIFEMTSQCNLRCKYCCYNDCYTTFQNRKSGVLSFDIAKTVIDFIATKCDAVQNRSVNTPIIFSFYGGEPLLYGENIKKIVQYVKTKNFHNRTIRFSITTNGTLIHNYIDFLAENQFAVLVSLDGNAFHNANRVFPNGTPSFDKVVNNLKICQNRYPDYFKTIRFNAVYTKLSDMDEMIKFFLSTFNKYPTISPLHEAQEEADNVSIIKELYKKILPTTNEKHKFAPDFFLEIPIHKQIAHILTKLLQGSYIFEWQFNEEDAPKMPTSTCIPFTKKLYVTATGDLIQCEKIDRSAPLGKVQKDKVLIDTEAIATQFNRKIYNNIRQCSKCYFQQACNQCVFLIDKHCSQFMSQEMFANKLSEVFTYIENNPSVVELIKNNLILH